MTRRSWVYINKEVFFFSFFSLVPSPQGQNDPWAKKLNK
jgi:hypothetical protein